MSRIDEILAKQKALADELEMAKQERAFNKRITNLYGLSDKKRSIDDHS